MRDTYQVVAATHSEKHGWVVHVNGGTFSDTAPVPSEFIVEHRAVITLVCVQLNRDLTSRCPVCRGAPNVNMRVGYNGRSSDDLASVIKEVEIYCGTRGCPGSVSVLMDESKTFEKGIIQHAVDIWNDESRSNKVNEKKNRYQFKTVFSLDGEMLVRKTGDHWEVMVQAEGLSGGKWVPLSKFEYLKISPFSNIVNHVEEHEETMAPACVGCGELPVVSIKLERDQGTWLLKIGSVEFACRCTNIVAPGNDEGIHECPVVNARNRWNRRNK